MFSESIFPSSFLNTLVLSSVESDLSIIIKLAPFSRQYPLLALNPCLPRSLYLKITPSRAEICSNALRVSAFSFDPFITPKALTSTF